MPNVGTGCIEEKVSCSSVFIDLSVASHPNASWFSSTIKHSTLTKTLFPQVMHVNTLYSIYKLCGQIAIFFLHKDITRAKKTYKVEKEQKK